MKSPIRQVSKAWTLALLLALGAQAVPAKNPKDQQPPGGCNVYPIALSLSSVSNIATGTVLSNLRNGADTGEFGWLTWTGNRSQDALADSLTTPGNSETYVNPFNKKDQELVPRKWVRAAGSDKGKNVKAALDNLKKREIVVPLWYQADKKEKAYRIAGFAKVQLLSYDLNNTDKISLKYLGITDCHKGNDAPIVNAGEDQVIAYPQRANLNGSVIDDGLPRGATLMSTWSKVSGPGDVVFSEIHNPVTRVSFSDPGTYVLQLSATDSSKSASDQVTITVNYGNTAPVANAQALNTLEDVAVNVTLTGSDIDGDLLTFTVLTTPSFGVLSGTPPVLVYTPNANLSGTDSFTFKVNDGGLDSAPATVTIDVAAVNDPPVAYSQSVSTDEDVPVSVVLAGNDVEGAALGYTIVSSPVHGTLSGVAPNLVYTPVANYFGSDQFTFRVDDGALVSPVASVTLTVRAVNDPPVAQSDSVVLSEDGSVDLVLRGSDVEGSPLTFSVVTPPGHGVLSGTAPALRYVPAVNYNGPDSFTFKVNDGMADSAVAVVTINVQPVNDAPMALNDTVSLDEDSSANILLRGTDVEGSALTFSIVTPPAHGVLSGTAPNVTYLPTANYYGDDSFTFKVNDGALDSAVATVTLHVRAVNDVPVALNDSVVLAEDGSVDLVLRGTDVEGSALSFSVVTPPAHGTLSGTPPSVHYSPTANYNGPDSFTFKVNDGTADSAAAVVNITVQPVNDAPVALDQTASLDEDTSADLVLRGTDVEGNALTFSIVTPPAHGVLSGTPPSVSYLPAANYYGDDGFTFKVNDGALDSGLATVTLHVRPVNDVPVALNDSVSLDEDSSAEILLRGTDVEGSALSFSVITPPAHGALSGVPPALHYSPAANYNGPDSFTFKVNDGTADSVAAVVNITVRPVNDAPVALDQTASLDEDTSADLVLQGSDVEGSALLFSIVTPPAHGALGGTPPNVTYLPAANYFGDDSFTFKVNDGALDSGVATVTLHVRPVNDAPVALNDSVVLAEDGSVDVVLRGSDVEGSALSFSVVTPPAHGSLSGTPPSVRYSPTANYNGPDSFTFRVNDGTADSALATVAITVTPVNDAPVAIDDSASLDEDTSVDLVLRGSDIEGSALTFSIVTPPAHGALSGTLPNVHYVPTANYFGTDAFTFKANDGELDSVAATVTLTVRPVNDVPVALNQQVTLAEDTSAHILLAGTDIEGSPLTFTVVNLPVHGTLSGTAPDVTYVPDPNYHGPDGLTFKVNDGTVDSALATVAITVTPVNDAPVAAPQSLSTPEDTALNITLTGNDIDGDSLTYAVVNGPAHGSLSGTPPNLTYTPAANYFGADHFDFVVNDATVDSALATVTIDVTPVNDPPVAAPLSVSTPEDMSVNVTLSGSDIEGSELTYVVTRLPAHGSLSGSSPDLVYTPNANFNGNDNFAYRVFDGTDNSAVADVSITVTPVNDVPVADSQFVQAIENEVTPITLTGSDVDHDALTYTIVDGPTNGTLSGDAPNLTYVPDLTNHPETDAFTFTVSDGVETSTLATVTIDIIYNQPPVVNAGPDRAVRLLTDVITLAGSATDDGWPRNSTLQYSWGVKYGPGTVTFGDASSAVTTASFSERGLYVLELSASDSQYTSSDLVEVRVDMICSANPSGAVAWWPANYIGTETVAGNTAVLEGGVTYAPGKVGGAFAFDGIDGRVKVDAHPSLDIGAANSLTIEFWVNSVDVSRSVRLLGWHSDVDVFSEDHGITIFQSGGELHVQLYDTNSTPHEFVGFNVLTNNTWTHVAVTYDRVAGQGRIYINGALRTTSNLGSFRPRTTFPLFFGHLLSDSYYFEGLLDEITLYPRALDAQEIHEVYAANGTGKCPISSNLPPLVNAGSDVYLQAPGVATLSGSATDDGQPVPASLRAAWSVVSGPGNVTFGDSTALTTTASFDSAGIYVLRLSVDDAAIARSDVVEVRVASVCTVKNIPGLVAWFTGNGHASDVMGGRQAQLAAGLGFANGRVGSAFSFDGVNDSARVLGDPALDVGQGTGFSLEFWVNSADVTRNARLVGYHNGLSQNGTNIGVNVFQSSGNIHAQIPDQTGNAHEFVASAVLTLNTWTHVVVTYDRTRGVARTYINGAQKIASNVGTYLARTVGNLHFGNVPFDVNYFRGLLDEVSVYNRTLDAQEVYELFAAGSVGKCPNDLNQGPIVNAGPDVFLRDTAQVANLNGSVTDDGLPPGYGVRSLWSVVSAPGIVTFGNPTNSVTTAGFSAAGLYVLRLSADDGLVSSSDLMEVRVASLCTVKDVPGLVSWWPGNANGNDVVGVNHARLGGGVAFASGRVSAAFSFDGTNDAVQVAAHPSLDVGQGNGLSLEFWMNSLDVTRFTRVVGWHFGSGSVGTNFGVNIYQQSGGVSAQIYDLAGTPHEMGAANTLTNGVWTHVAVTYDRTTGLGRIYVNGALRTTSTLGMYQPRTSYNLYFGNLPSDTGFYRGMLDEVSLYNRTLDAQEVYDIYNSGPVGKCPVDQNQAPVVNAGPNVTLAAVTDVATLNGSVTDDGLPAGAGVRALWSKVDGPGTVTFGDPTAPGTAASFTAPGIYVLNLAADDSAVLRNDVMEVRVAMPCSTAPSGLVAWWPGNGTAQEVIGGRDGRLAGGTAFASGRVSAAFSFDGVNDAVHVPANAALDVGLGSGLTIEFWVNPTDITRSGRMVSWHSGLPGSGTNFGVGVQMLGRTVNAQLYDVAGNSRDVNAANALTNNVWTHVAVTYDRAAGQGRVYINGLPRTTVTVGTNTPRTNYKLYFGNVPFDPNFFRGLLDEISIYDHALTSNEVAAVFAAGAAGKCPPAPVGPMFAGGIASVQPTDTVTVDDHGRRTAMTDGSGTTSYTYDAQGHLSRVSKSWSAHAGAPAVETALVYDYDNLGRFVGVHSTMVNGASMSYVWSDANQLLEVVDPHSGSTVYHYDAAGKAVSYTYPDGVMGSRFGVLDNVTCNDEPGATVVCDADGYRARRTVTVGSRTVTTYYVVSPLTVTGAAQLVEELTFDSGDPLFATPAVTRVYVHGLHTISHEELENGAWALYFYE